MKNEKLHLQMWIPTTKASKPVRVEGSLLNPKTTSLSLGHKHSLLHHRHCFSFFPSLMCFATVATSASVSSLGCDLCCLSAQLCLSSLQYCLSLQHPNQNKPKQIAVNDSTIKFMQQFLIMYQYSYQLQYSDQFWRSHSRYGEKRIITLEL